MKTKKIILIIAIILVVLGLAIGGFFLIKHQNNTEENKTSFTLPKDYDYKYVLKYTADSNYYIYLLETNEIKLVIEDSSSNVTESTLDISDEAKEKVISFLEETFTNQSSQELEIQKEDATEKQIRIINALVSNSSNILTLEEDLTFTSDESEILNSLKYRSALIKKQTIATTDNEIISNISEYLNEVIDTDENEIRDLVTSKYNRTLETNYTVSLNLELKYLGKDTISLTYLESGNIGNTKYDKLKGYVFTLSGELVEFKETDKEKYLAKIDEYLKLTDTYTKFKDEISEKYLDNIEEGIFDSGNWYVSENNIVFIVTSDMLEVEDYNFKYIEISVPDYYSEFTAE